MKKLIYAYLPALALGAYAFAKALIWLKALQSAAGIG